MNSRADGGIISLFPPLPLLLFLNFILFFIYFYLLFIFLFVFNKLLGSHGHRLFTGSCLPLRKINGKPRSGSKSIPLPYLFSFISSPLSLSNPPIQIQSLDYTPKLSSQILHGLLLNFSKLQHPPATQKSANQQFHQKNSPK